MTNLFKEDNFEVMKQIVEVAISLPVQKTFYYNIPERMIGSLQVGMRLLVPFKGRRITAFSIEILERPPEEIKERLRDVEEILDDTPIIDHQMLHLYRWISDYYLHPLGEVIKTGLPPGLQPKSESILELTEEGLRSLNLGGLEPIQEKVLREIERNGKISFNRILRKFHKELSRSQVLSWERKGLLQIKAGINGRKVKPRFENVVYFKAEEPHESLKKREKAILDFIKERKTISYSELRREFKNLSNPVQSLKAKGLISISKKEIFRNHSSKSELIPYPKPALTPNQKIALDEIIKGIRSKRYSPFLIYGVTGSGKTEIYLRAVEEVLQQGKEAIVLVPEISLTSQLLSRFNDRFAKNLSLLHSAMSQGERYDQWRKVWRGEVKIVIGARSAIFAPFKNIGIIVVDEEHDPSYKQEERLKYNARDLAVVRAKQSNATLLLGSATPSLESFYNAEKGKFHLIKLPERIEGKPLPHIEVIDMRKDKGILSERLKALLQKNIEEKRQGFLFLNRRGFANFILCRDCGFTFKCPNCSVTLTFHLRDKSLKCHYCDYKIFPPGDCPSCKGYQLKAMGIGTERLEEEIRSLFPDAHVERMDRDTTRRRRSHQRILKRLESGEIGILIGTQMIVKGHDFPNITFVGVVSADTSLHFPDFRSSERTFQLLTQVAGRAGRGERPGEVIIQTFNPEHYSIAKARDHNFIGFYNEEIKFRKSLDYPPFFRLINFRVIGNSERRTRLMAEHMGRIGRSLLENNYKNGIELLGPSMAPFSKIRGKFRWQMLAKSKNHIILHKFARELEIRFFEETKGRGINLDIDVDPVSIL